MKIYTIQCKGKPLGKVYFADRFLTKLRGLIGRRLKEDEGLLLSPCNQIHCFMMSYPIDVVYLSAEWCIIQIDEAMRPGTIGGRVKNCRHLLELPAGRCKEKGFTVGDRLILIGMEE